MFLIGVGLLAWCIRRAVGGSDLSQLREASAAQVTALLLCSLVSVAANGTMFWLLIRPVRPLPFADVHLVNFVVNLLNYAPVRLGMVTRLAHHRRVDGMSYLHLLAWYGAVAILMFTALGAMLAATLLRPQVDAVWALLLLAMLAAPTILLVRLSNHQQLPGRIRPATELTRHGPTMALCMGLRLVDTAAYAGRLYAAFAIAGIDLSARDTVYLALVSMVTSLLPAGTLGFREAGVALAAPYFVTPELAGATAAQIEAWSALAALIDRSAEALIFVPTGVVGLVWMWRKWREKADCRESGAGRPVYTHKG